ncbi:MAG: SDR family oxidoreductase [Candidatus Omnitrophota bacterium]|jgi:NAD(P)-dependent dehydrogenase (short-subunit alcohol dehydrogenase family)
MEKKNIFILGVGSDIGKELAKRYLAHENFYVAGTYRRKSSVADLSMGKNLKLFRCDISSQADIKMAAAAYGRLQKGWDIFISCAGTLEPVGDFFKTDFDAWEKSVTVNCLGQLRFLHSIYQYRKKRATAHVVFFTGGGTNSAMTHYSAYCASKIFLMKACELLDDENTGLNVFIVGPGWVRTKILNQTLKNPKAAGKSYGRTINFLSSADPGTSHDDIFECINWCIKQGRAVMGGRNISVVHDAWRNGGKTLIQQLRRDPNKFKLRRFKNS